MELTQDQKEFLKALYALADAYRDKGVECSGVGSPRTVLPNLPSNTSHRVEVIELAVRLWIVQDDRTSTPIAEQLPLEPID